MKSNPSNTQLNIDTGQKKSSAAVTAKPTMKQVLLRILLVAIWLSMMVLIAWFSSQPADASTEQSHTVGTVICRIVIKDFKTFTQALKQYYIELVDHFVRKSAHFCEYAALGALSLHVSVTLLSSRLAGSLRKNAPTIDSTTFNDIKIRKLFHFLIWFAFPVLWCLFYSITDEIHQYYVEGRYASVTDVLIDTAGSAFGIVVILVIRLITKKIVSRRKKRNSNIQNN